MSISIKETDLQYAKGIVEDISKTLWNIYRDYKNNDFYATHEIKDLCIDLSEDLDFATSLLGGKITTEMPLQQSAEIAKTHAEKE